MPPDGNYQVGYKKPPLHSRFKPGRAGNAGGRKKQADGFACLFTEALNETVTITENGRARTISKRELLVNGQVIQLWASARSSANRRGRHWLLCIAFD
jgi:hypothetical protein